MIAIRWACSAARRTHAWNHGDRLVVAAATRQCRFYWRETYLRVQLVDTTDGITNVTTLNGTANDHPGEDTVRVDKGLEAALFAEAVSCIFVSFDDQVVHHEAVEITVACNKCHEGEERREQVRFAAKRNSRR